MAQKYRYKPIQDSTPYIRGRLPSVLPSLNFVYFIRKKFIEFEGDSRNIVALTDPSCEQLSYVVYMWQIRPIMELGLTLKIEDKSRLPQEYRRMFRHLPSVNVILNGNPLENKSTVNRVGSFYFEGDEECMLIVNYEEKYMYVGETKDGKPSGKGFLEWRIDQPEGYKFIGEFKEGKRYGLGEMRNAEGTVYKGSFMNDQKNGVGEEIKFQKNCQSEHGRVSTEHYEGNFQQGAREGVGILHCEQGVYEGSWKKGAREGKGKVQYANGDVYEGDWRHGERQGEGVLVQSCGNKYIGHFQKGKKHGKGNIHFVGGDRYEGEWLEDTIHGNGLYNWFSEEETQQDYYEGDWHYGQATGQGCFYFSTSEGGSFYQGKVKDGRKHGRGKLTEWKGESSVQTEALWENDKLVRLIARKTNEDQE